MPNVIWSAFFSFLRLRCDVEAEFVNAGCNSSEGSGVSVSKEIEETFVTIWVQGIPVVAGIAARQVRERHLTTALLRCVSGLRSIKNNNV